MATSPIEVLLFEDDEGQALLTKEALEKERFVVEVARTGREGLDRALAHEHQVYLIDMQLPDIKGIEVLRRIHAIKPGVVAIIVTGHGDEAAAVEAMKLGAYDYIVKSPYMGHLAAIPVVIREGLERCHLKNERAQLQTEVWEQARLLEERNAELRRVNDELKRLDQRKSDLISVVSHELRTPLATINEFTAILSDGIAGPVTPDQQEYLAIIKANVDRLARIIGNLLDMGKIEAGRVLLDKKLLECGELIDHVIQSMRPLAESQQVTLDVALPSGLPNIFADADKITQVLTNLISNALKCSRGPARVTVSVEEHPNELQCNVVDTGVGIAADDIPKLFEKFQQLSRTTDGKAPKGTGLGLAISKRLIELHGGRIWVTSTPEQGSTFSFTLPKYHPEEVFKEYLRTGIVNAKRKQSRFSIIVVSMLNFQELKALHGLEEVSRLLKELEIILSETVRRKDGDIVVRWQRGDMLVVLAEVNQSGSQAIAQRLKRLIDEHAFSVAGNPVHIKLGVTTATYPDEAMTEDELLALVERGLHRIEQHKTRILVVDDEPKIRHFIKEALELREYDVAAAASGPDALEQLKQQKADLILLDVMMPVMDGYEVYHLLKEDPMMRDIPVIIVTAKGERKDRQLGMESTTYNYLAKPFQLEDLVAKVREVLQQHPVKP